MICARHFGREVGPLAAGIATAQAVAGLWNADVPSTARTRWIFRPEGRCVLHMPPFLGVAVAGALGALARYGMGRLMHGLSVGFPWGTFVTNVLGCLLIAAFGALALRDVPLAPFLRVDVMTGFVGAFTTFSTFQLEGVMLWESAPTRAALYLFGSVAAGLVAVWLGGALLGTPA